jgi:hypothetical protein
MDYSPHAVQVHLSRDQYAVGSGANQDGVKSRSTVLRQYLQDDAAMACRKALAVAAKYVGCRPGSSRHWRSLAATNLSQRIDNSSVLHMTFYGSSASGPVRLRICMCSSCKKHADVVHDAHFDDMTMACAQLSRHRCDHHWLSLPKGPASVGGQQ